MVKKRMLLITALALALLFTVGSAYAATVEIVGPTEVNPADGTFSIDILISNISPLNNLDFWQLGLAISPGLNATFVSASGSANPNYVFFGNSFDFAFALLNPFQITVGDLTASGTGVSDVVGKLLATVVIDISNAVPGELYSISLFDSGSTFFGDAQGGIIFDINLLADYQFQVVPIPGTALLLGCGLLGLLGIRRRKR